MLKDDVTRVMHNNMNRKTSPQRYSEKVYSPSVDYNLNQGNHNNSNHNNGQPYSRRRNNSRPKKNGYNFNERFVKQNDIIIKLLKEIRDHMLSISKCDRGDEERLGYEVQGEMEDGIISDEQQSYSNGEYDDETLDDDYGNE